MPEDLTAIAAPFRTWHKGGAASRKLADVDQVKPVDVLCRVDGVDDERRIDM